MIDEVCAYIKNYFDCEKFYGTITISNGALVGFDDKLATNQYFRIVGSVFNDGVYKYPATTLKDEIFKGGAVWALALPPAFLDDVKEIEEWQATYGSASSSVMSPYTSENLANVGGYTKSGAGSLNADGTPTTNTWQGAFGARLKRWKKLCLNS